MLAVACLVLVQVVALRLAVAWRLLVAQLKVVVALKEDRLIQKHVIHIGGLVKRRFWSRMKCRPTGAHFVLKLIKSVSALLSSEPMLWLLVPTRFHYRLPHSPRLACTTNVAWAKSPSNIIHKLKLMSVYQFDMKCCHGIPHFPKDYAKTVHVSLAVAELAVQDFGCKV